MGRDGGQLDGMELASHPSTKALSMMVAKKPLYPVILAERNRLIQQIIRRILAECGEVCLVGETDSQEHLCRLLEQPESNQALVLLDQGLAGRPLLETLAELKQICSERKVLLLSTHKDSEHANQALGLGARGYLLKEDLAAELPGAIDTIRRGGVYRPSWYRAERPGNF
jgi:two-component system, NarL family, invasion response regulator UvrY